jgi:anti-anti-sigma regulatory factor
MILNQPSRLSAHIVRIADSADLEAARRLDVSRFACQEGRTVVVLDCTAIPQFDVRALEALLALRRHLVTDGVGTVMVAIRQPTRWGAAITRLIPARLDILLAQLPRHVGPLRRAV